METRAYFEKKFKNGECPNEEDYYALFDSTIGYKEDGIEKPLGVNPLKIKGGLSVGEGEGLSKDGDLLLRLNSDKHWEFLQKGNGSDTQLVLRSKVEGNKDFLIETDGRVGIGAFEGRPEATLHIRQNTDYRGDYFKIDRNDNITEPIFTIDEYGGLAVAGMIESQSGGFKFPGESSSIQSKASHDGVLTFSFIPQGVAIQVNDDNPQSYNEFSLVFNNCEEAPRIYALTESVSAAGCMMIPIPLNARRVEAIGVYGWNYDQNDDNENEDKAKIILNISGNNLNIFDHKIDGNGMFDLIEPVNFDLTQVDYRVRFLTLVIIKDIYGDNSGSYLQIKGCFIRFS